jgi:(E)-4-hydroxy-3-methylbut-2-enyl-diphosphate synthase
MWKERLLRRSLPAVRRDLEELSAIGCDLVRFAVPDLASARLLGELAATTAMPLVADIHFDYRIALACLDHPLAKVRINPGNIGEEWKVREVISKARDTGISLRIGVNAGSLPRQLQSLKNQASALLEAAELEMESLEKLRFTSAVFSLKSSDIDTTIRANVLFSRRYDYPLHIGMTEAGPTIPGIVSNTIGISSLLQKGIGDTVRVSLSATPREEVLTAVEILRAAKVRDQGVRLISCPRCGRASLDVHAFLEEVNYNIQHIKKPLVIAVMGCAVNGPGEARHADIGIAGAGKMAIIFKAGEVVRRVPHQQAAKVFLEEIEKLCMQE